MTAFEGFPASTVQFLAELRANNDREWFAAHREAYLAHYVAPARAFVAAAAAALAGRAPGIVADPRIDGSILRVTRDMRFARGAPPYKSHLDIWLWEGERAVAVSGLYLRLTPETLALGVGTRPLAGPALGRFREALADEARAAELLAAIEPLRRVGWELNPERYRRTPGGPAAEPVAGLLRRDAVRLTHSGPHPPDLASPAFAHACVAAWAQALGVHRWLVEALSDGRATAGPPLTTAMR